MPHEIEVYIPRSRLLFHRERHFGDEDTEPFVDQEELLGYFAGGTIIPGLIDVLFQNQSTLRLLIISHSVDAYDATNSDAGRWVYA